MRSAERSLLALRAKTQSSVVSMGTKERASQSKAFAERAMCAAELSDACALLSVVDAEPSESVPS